MYLLYAIGLAVAGVRLSTSLEHIVMFGVTTKLLVKYLSSKLTMTDVSTLQKCTTIMILINIAFAIFMCVGPDLVGVSVTFTVIGRLKNDIYFRFFLEIGYVRTYVCQHLP